MQTLLTKIGKGANSSKDLTWEEAKRAMRLLVEGQVTPVQVGAFVMAMRMKTESVTELAAFVSAAREYVPPLIINTDLPLVDLPTYAGKETTFHASIAGAIIAASSGVAILMHGYESIPNRVGSGPVLAELGIPADLSPSQVALEVASKGFGYLDVSLYHPPLARFLDLRKELGLRTFFHPVSRMLNPARAKAQVIGMTHPPYFEKTAEAARMLGTPRGLVVRGMEGEPELSIAGITKVIELQGDRIFPLSLQAKDLGLPAGGSSDMAGFAREQIGREADLLRKILRNEVRGGQRDWVLMNAAMLLYASGKTPSISSALPLVVRALESGAAAEKLAQVATGITAVGSMAASVQDKKDQ
jgi:anthranilate phosphoribosyltransferase